MRPSLPFAFSWFVALAVSCGERLTTSDLSGLPSRVVQRVTRGGPNPSPQLVEVTNSGACNLALTAQSATAQGGAWLSVTPNTSQVAPDASVMLSIAIDVIAPALVPGTYTGTVEVAGTCTTSGQPATGSPRLVSVNLFVSEDVAAIDAPPAVEQDPWQLLNVWVAVRAPTFAPAARADHSAVWTNRGLVVWGGSGLNTGAVYESSGKGWLNNVSTAGAPSGRSNHTAVWTGEGHPTLPPQMLVWGGIAGGTETATGGRLSPGATTFTWSSLSAAGAPSARAEHTAVWTGAKMVVWGGIAGGTRLATGGRYDPATDAWSSVATMSAPSARRGHVAVWTGTRMLVWGGETAPGTFAGDGASYDPTLDAWSPMAATGAPSPRAFAVAAWTGARLLVWGGLGASGAQADGAAYDPALDRWHALETDGAPAARARATAVWTGRQMIVWGGEDAGTALGDGAAYDPIAASWMALPALDAPSARTRHSATWTGTEMIVWGGSDTAGTPLATGQSLR